MNYRIEGVRGLSLTVSELAQAWDLTDARIREFLREGMPIAIQSPKKGQPHLLSLADCTEWRLDKSKKAGYVGRPPKEKVENDAKSQLDAIRIQKAELDLAERRGDLIHANIFVPYLDDKMVALRVALAALAQEVAEEFPDIPGIGRVIRFIAKRIGEKLNSFAAEMRGIPAEAEAAAAARQ